MQRLATLDHTFGSNKISQSWHDLFLWEQVLNKYPPVRILELGTFTGGMALYLQVQSIMRSASFMTFDVADIEGIRKDRPDSPFRSHWNLPFMKLDCLSSDGIKVISSYIKWKGRTILFCDNGNKELEAEIYTPFLKEGDVLAVHDWGSECYKVPEELVLIEPIEGIYEELESMTRFFIK